MQAGTHQTAEARKLISESQRRRYAHLRALKDSHQRILQLLDQCATYVDGAAESDPLARYLSEELDRALQESKLAGIAAATELRDSQD